MSWLIGFGSESEQGGATGGGRFFNLASTLNRDHGGRPESLVEVSCTADFNTFDVGLYNNRGDGLIFRGGVRNVVKAAYLYLGRSRAVLLICDIVGTMDDTIPPVSFLTYLVSEAKYVQDISVDPCLFAYVLYCTCL